MSITENLLIIYAGVLLINLIISAILWIHDKAPLYRAVFFLWLTTIFSLCVNGVLVQNDLFMVIGFSSAFFINIALSYLLSQITGIEVPWKLFVILLLFSYLVTISCFLLHFSFTLMALPVAVTVSVPALFTASKVLCTKWDTISVSAKCLSFITCLLAFHNIDFAFLRTVESFAPIGFAIAILLIFCLSIFAPAVVLEVLAEKQASLKELDRLKSSFFANISHEIRTPLTMILSPVESALQGDYENAVDKSFLQNLHRNAIKLLYLINNLLDFSKLEAGRMTMQVQEVDVVKLIRNYVGTVHSAFEAKEIQVDFISLNTSVSLFLDIGKMDKVVMNLFSNALKFTKKRGEVHIRVKDDNDACYIEFEDTGLGIPPDKIDAIFDRFGQADSSSTRKYEGTGIGLSLSKEYVVMHGGTISVESKYIKEYPENHGTTFTLTFPKGKKHLEKRDGVEFITDAELDESVTDHKFVGIEKIADTEGDDNKTSADGSNRNAPSALNLLVVEDNHDMRNFLKFLLQKHYLVHTAVNGEEGLNKTKQLKPDLIVSDVMMPIMNGYEMTKKIKADEQLKRIPVLMLTAKAELSHKIEGLEYGADDYLTKPFNSKELLTRIASLLKLKQMQDELLDLNKNLAAKVAEQLDVLTKTNKLKRYLPPQLVDSIIKGEKEVNFENERRKLTIFFSDIKDFSDTTDAMEAEELSSFLNEYLTEMTKIAHQWGGTLDKFVGDAIMIFFGAPETKTDKENALHCVKMAIEMQHTMKGLQDKWFHAGIQSPFQIRIGINTGTATVGNFGAEERLSYTAIGGQVNLAARLQDLASPGGILLSHSTWALVSDEIPCKERGKVKVKGIHQEILCYDVVM